MNLPSYDPAALEPVGPDNFLARVNAMIDWPALAPLMQEASQRFGQKLPVSTVRIALLKQWYDLADIALEFSILDRLSFRTFVGFAGDASSSDVEILNELRDGVWAQTAELRPVLAAVDEQLRAKGYTVQPGYVAEASVVPCTEGELQGLGTTQTEVPGPGELGRMVDAATAKAHAQGRIPTGPQAVPDNSATPSAAVAPAGGDMVKLGEKVQNGRVRAQVEWPWGQRSDITDILQVGRDYAFSPFARELTPYTHVSRRHAELMVHGDSVWVKDLGSRNGTYVNNDAVPSGQAFLIDNDAIIRFGPLLAVTIKVFD